MSLTSRPHLPLILPGQADKHLTHNDATVALDAAVQVSLKAVQNVPPVNPPPAAGMSWIVGSQPTGDWSRHAASLVSWGHSGWQYVTPLEGWRVWD